MTGLEIAAIGLTALSGAVSTFGSFQAQRAAAKGKEYEADVARKEAFRRRQESQVDAEDARREARRKLGTLRATYGTKGFALSGSALDVLEDQAAEFELAAQRQAYAGEVRASQLIDQAQGAEVEASSLRNASALSLVGGALSTGAAGTGVAIDLGVL